MRGNRDMQAALAIDWNSEMTITGSFISSYQTAAMPTYEIAGRLNLQNVTIADVNMVLDAVTAATIRHSIISYTLWISLTNPYYGPGTGYVVSTLAGSQSLSLGGRPIVVDVTSRTRGFPPREFHEP